MKGQWHGLAGEGTPATESHDLSPLFRTRVVKENQLPKVVLWPPCVRRDMCLYTQWINKIQGQNARQV